jgi:hypothetical protein
METQSCSKVAKKYTCNICDYNTYKKSSFIKHNSTVKHNKMIVGDKSDEKVSKSCENNYICNICKNEYKSRNGLWKHKQKCVEKKEDPEVFLTNLVLEVVKSNAELQKQNEDFKSLIIEQNKSIIDQNSKMIETVQEVCKNGIVNNSHNVVNSHNKAFNLQVFLNEECKDAMDINDFIDSVKLQLSDLELVGKLGFVDGISSIIIKNLKALKMNERPVHCTDMKRETMYVKEQGIWEKQEGDYKNLRKVIKRVAFKNSKNLSLYKELHPDYNDYYSKHSDHYLKLQIEAFGGSGNETIDNENKIIKKIAKEMTIDKSM